MLEEGGYLDAADIFDSVETSNAWQFFNLSLFG